jgi:hypothetical protein
MPEPHTFLWSWLRGGLSMWLVGAWLPEQVEELHARAEAQRALASPLHCWIGGHRVRSTDGRAVAYVVGIN